MQARVAVLVNVCSIERAFVKAVVEQCRLFAHEVVLSVGTHLHDGVTPEPEDFLVELLGLSHAGTDCPVRVVQYKVTPEIEFNPLKQRPKAFWHNVARMTAVNAIATDADWCLFLDGDEVPDGRMMKEWLHDGANLQEGHGYKIANYWYFREPIYQATECEDSAVLVHMPYVKVPGGVDPCLMTDNEREGILQYHGLPMHRKVCDAHGRVMIHHYSWVRSKDVLLEKARVWGHAKDEDWHDRIEKEFAGPFSGTDFVHQYRYREVPNMFGIDVGPTS